MPYDNEYSSYEPLRRIAESERVKNLLSNYRIRQRAEQKTNPITTINTAHLEYEGWQPNWILAIDGSYLPVAVENGYPGAEAAYVTIASVLLDMEKIRELDEMRPVEPKVFRKTRDAESIDDIVPGCNVVHDDDSSSKVSFRRALYNLLGSKQMSPDGETMLDTYEALLDYKPTNQKIQSCPFEDCPANGDYSPQKGIFTCFCSESRTFFSTDALRIHERMNPNGGSNDRVYSEIMQVIERLWVVHILRTLEKQKWLSSLRRLAILVDGPLAVFGQPAWISQAISQEIRRINQSVKQITGQDILIIGIEKGGEFAEHFEHLDQDEQGQFGKFPNQTVALLSDSYIKENIYLSDSTKLYGTGTYFGRKIFYKTKSGARIVATLPYLKEEDKDWRTTEIDQYPRLSDATRLLDEVVSSRYPNALQPIVAAHSEASIPLNLGKRVLEKLARELTSERK